MKTNTKPDIKFLSASLKLNETSSKYEADIEVMVDGKKLADRQDISQFDFEHFVVARQLIHLENNSSVEYCPYKELLEDRIIKVAKHLQLSESLYQQCIDEAFLNLTIDNI